jgi:hypothetical protein
MTDIWKDMADVVSPGLVGGRLSRLVESQEQIATARLLAGDLDKQAALEAMLEPTKPARRPGTEQLDYLLSTPWRYPPLRYGSRYGRRFEPSLFYGALGTRTCLAESAYYRWVFFTDIQSPLRSIQSQHTMYQAQYRSEQGLRLQHAPFESYQDALTHPSNYQASQALGTNMRKAGIEVFEFPSARDIKGGNNVALFTSAALNSTHAEKQRAWLCTTGVDEVVISYKGRPSEVHRFPIEDYLDNGVFPKPA